ncbi:TetR/AcrR family transcriptional regulator [Demequina sp. NBRC 110055]|uniref:TetR/AcrR family transcriptional regulator n=1 Tax=Demequina sp. NBRC 110055 TaxID=1570344 RepID=UPI000A034B7F|nr:TetR family transcriptional regulator [Demequina sp. NBRC 110055]
MTNSESRQSNARGPYAKSEQRRQVILDAATRLFAERGYTASSVRDVAAAAGISEAGLRHHFGTKVALLQEVLARREADDLGETREALSGADTLRRILEITERNSHQRHVVELYVALSAEATAEDHPAHEYFVNRYAWVEDLLTTAGERLLHEGALRPGIDPRTFARTLTGVLDGLQVQWLLRPEVDMVAAARAFIDSQLLMPLAELATPPPQPLD